MQMSAKLPSTKMDLPLMMDSSKTTAMPKTKISWKNSMKDTSHLSWGQNIPKANSQLVWVTKLKKIMSHPHHQPMSNSQDKDILWARPKRKPNLPRNQKPVRTSSFSPIKIGKSQQCESVSLMDQQSWWKQTWTHLFRMSTITSPQSVEDPPSIWLVVFLPNPLTWNQLLKQATFLEELSSKNDHLPI